MGHRRRARAGRYRLRLIRGRSPRTPSTTSRCRPPVIHLNPAGDQLVNLATWLWIDPGAMQVPPASVDAGPVTVTATVEWAAACTVTGAPGGGPLPGLQRSASRPIRVAEAQAVKTR